MSKTDVLVLGCSPRKDGNSDYAARILHKLAEDLELESELLFLRDYKVRPCIGCHQCALRQDFACILDSSDDCRTVLRKIDHAGLLCLCSPIFFYHLPAGFKALIDRSQSYYERWMKTKSSRFDRKALCVLLAGRKKGDLLFSGSLLTLKYFLEPFYYEVYDLCLRGIDLKDDLVRDEAGRTQISRFAGQYMEGG
ncbi:flavodoxin family protein [Desulfonatronovibrio magnus]|uniref:flavodoxin family protein n=1 Tax=Desulfonatronovibrio magnus TaxID=698827 RepID=UPI00069871CE|nr:NAD(P)H-dependent oxidoreductase [Desulfonatronovibrio magnus]